MNSEGHLNHSKISQQIFQNHANMKVVSLAFRVCLCPPPPSPSIFKFSRYVHLRVMLRRSVVLTIILNCPRPIVIYTYFWQTNPIPVNYKINIFLICALNPYYQFSAYFLKHCKPPFSQRKQQLVANQEHCLLPILIGLL